MSESIEQVRSKIYEGDEKVQKVRITFWFIWGRELVISNAQSSI
jgi:hypothetical protein